ncbi:MAG: nucleoside-diphosphate kinase [Chitinophagales bacterium]
MTTNRTLTILKPDSVVNGKTGSIIQKICDAGFKIIAMKYVRLTHEQAGKFYAVHRERPFYNDLVKFMTSGTVIPAILEKENAVEDFRKLIGSTNPVNAAEGTIRKLFAESVERNAIHGSDSDENAAIEGSFFFSEMERF